MASFKVLPGIVLLKCIDRLPHKKRPDDGNVNAGMAGPSSRTRRVSHPGRKVRGSPVHVGTEFTPLKLKYWKWRSMYSSALDWSSHLHTPYTH